MCEKRRKMGQKHTKNVSKLTKMLRNVNECLKYKKMSAKAKICMKTVNIIYKIDQKQ